MKKKVLFCVPPSVGGAERVTLTIAKLLNKDEYDIIVAIVGCTTGEIVQFIPNYMKMVHVKTRNIWDFTIIRLIKMLNRERPNIVFCSLMYLNTRVIIAARFVGNIKIIVRNNNGFDNMRWDNRFLIKKLYPKADAIILQTEEMRKEMMANIKMESSLLHVIFNPIDTDSIDKGIIGKVSPMEMSFTNYVFVGRIHHSKGLDILIPAFKKMLEINPKSHLTLVGKVDESSSYYQRLVNMITELGLDAYITWAGFQKNPYVYIKYADCFVLPSRIEGLPNVVLDAMYLKVPVVATRSVPVIDRIVTSDRGIVVDVEDIDELARAMKRILEMKITKSYVQSSKAEILRLFDN